MREKNDDWYEENEADSPSRKEPSNEEVQRILAEMDKKAKNHIRYLIMEGFIEKTETPGVFKYTPEGLVLVQMQYKRLQDEGLI
jgi:hypothetical protein